MTRLRVTVGIYGEQVGYTTSGLNGAGIRHRVQQLLVGRLVESRKWCNVVLNWGTF